MHWPTHSLLQSSDMAAIPLDPCKVMTFKVPVVYDMVTLLKGKRPP